MQRSQWLRDQRRLAEEQENTIFAPIYDQNWGAIDPSHQDFLGKFLAQCPAKSTVLDAACGTGKYWALILASGRAVLGIDQAQEMLNRAKAKFPDVRVQKLGLQEMSFEREFDAIICVDAMEMVCPEDWPVVLRNFHRALKPNGHLYFTVERADDAEIQAAFEKGRQMDLPLVQGEWAHEGGYHYYPSIDQVKTWISEAGFTLLDETVAAFADTIMPDVDSGVSGGYGYHHFIVSK